MSTISEIRPSPIAGTWYSGDAARLRREVQRYLDDARLPALEGEVLAVIAPHAGHRYSGRTAGHAFAAVRGQAPELVIVVSPMHAPYPGSVLTTAHRAYATPLGPVWVDEPARAELEEALSDLEIDLTHVAYDTEHSLEIEIPFLQVALTGDFRLLPVMLRSQSPRVAQLTGQALARVAGKRRSLMVASTDLSHFYPAEVARQLDAEMLRRFESFTPEALFEAERQGKGFACGVAAVAAVLWACRDLGGKRVIILHYSHSGEETGDDSSVVGYGAAAVLKVN